MSDQILTISPWHYRNLFLLSFYLIGINFSDLLTLQKENLIEDFEEGSTQEYQLDAIKAITDIFEGQRLNGGDFEFSLTQTGALHSKALSCCENWETFLPKISSVFQY